MRVAPDVVNHARSDAHEGSGSALVVRNQMKHMLRDIADGVDLPLAAAAEYLIFFTKHTELFDELHSATLAADDSGIYERRFADFVAKSQASFAQATPLPYHPYSAQCATATSTAAKSEGMASSHTPPASAPYAAADLYLSPQAPSLSHRPLPATVASSAAPQPTPAPPSHHPLPQTPQPLGATEVTTDQLLQGLRTLLALQRVTPDSPTVGGLPHPLAPQFDAEVSAYGPQPTPLLACGSAARHGAPSAAYTPGITPPHAPPMAPHVPPAPLAPPSFPTGPLMPSPGPSSPMPSHGFSPPPGPPPSGLPGSPIVTPHSAALSLPAPSYYVDPAPTLDAAAGLQLAPWRDFVLRSWPRTPQAGVAMGKRMKHLPPSALANLRAVFSIHTQYLLKRTPLVEMLASEYLYTVYVEQSSPALFIDALLHDAAHTAGAGTLVTAFANMEPKLLAGPLGKAVVEMQRTTTSAASRLLAFFTSLDAYLLSDTVQSAERIKFKDSAPRDDETPQDYFARMETMAAERALSPNDVYDTVRPMLRTHARDLFMQANTEMGSLSSMRRWLELAPRAQLTFAALRGAPAKGRTMLVEGEGGATEAPVVWQSHSSGFEMPLPPQALEAIAASVAARMGQSQGQSSQPTPGSGSAFQAMLDVLNRLAGGRGRGGGSELGDTFPTRQQRATLDADKCYPILYPGAPIPLNGKRVGGAGWTGGPAPCAACVKHRPTITDWLDYEELERRAESDPSLLDANGKVKKLATQAFLHNAWRCPHFNSDAAAKAQSDPTQFGWMLAEYRR